MVTVARIAPLSRPSSAPDCDYCRRNAHGNRSLLSLATTRVLVAENCNWLWLCDRHGAEFTEAK